MNQLPLNYKKNGYDYTLVFRDGAACIYRQEIDGKTIGYEACEVILAPAGMVFDKWVEEREKLPSTEQWGVKAFTAKTIERAVELAERINEQVRQRQKAA